MIELKMNLKVCEGCGALWLRAETFGGIYCKRCAKVLAEFPASQPMRPHTPRRMRRVAGSTITAGGAR